MNPPRSDPPIGVRDAHAAPDGSAHRLAREREHALSSGARTALICALIAVFGLAASIFVAAEWRASALEANRKSFESTAAVLGSALEAKLSADVALTRTMRAHAALETQQSETQYLQWYRELQRGAPSSPDVVATFIQVVPASGLAGFRRQVETDPAFRELLGTKLQVIPSGRRPSYCLTRAIVGSDAAASLYPGLLDYCAPVVPGTGSVTRLPSVR